MLRFLQVMLLGLALCFGGALHAQDATTKTLRIVTLSPNLTEMVFALGHGNDVVAVTNYCRWPEEATRREKIGGLYDLNVEKLLSLRPTLVLHTADHRGAVDRLRHFGIHTAHVPTESMEDIFDGLDQIGGELGEEKRSRKLQAEIRGQLAEVSRLYKDKRRLKVLYVVDNSPGELRQIYVLGPGTYLNEIIERTGCENVMKDSKAFYPLVSREYIIAHPPELIITSKGEDTPEGRAAWQEFTGRSGKDAPRFLFIDDPHLSIPGPSVGLKALELGVKIDEVRRQLD